MPGHEFEKNVQQRLDELKLRPSETVWKNVEMNIREEKRRRRAILWLPILLLFLGTSGYFLINKNGFVSGETAVKTKPTKEKNNSSTSTIAKDLQNEEKEKNKNQELSPKDLNEKSVAKIPKNRNTSSSTKQSQLSNNKHFDKNTIAVSNDKDQVQSLTKGQENFDLNNQNDVQLKGNDEDLIEYANINLTLIKGSSPAVGILIPGNHSATIQTPEVDLNALSASNKNEKYRSAKWQWGLDLSLGTSSANSELSLLKSTAQMDNGSLGVNVGSNFQTSSGRPSSITIEPGFYWAAGGFIQRNFSNSFALSTGLRYAQYSTRIFTETREDSSRIFIYSTNSATADQAGQYTNRYHFLELPVTAQFKLNKTNSFPIFANLGMSVGWLLRANALNFEGNSGANLFNETQFGLHGGFSFGVLNKSKYPLRVGPSVNYKLSELMENASSNKHLLSFGVDFRVLLKK